jgi:hypothetical protein
VSIGAIDAAAQSMRADSVVRCSRVEKWLCTVLFSFGLFCVGCGHEPTLIEQIQDNFENGNWDTTVVLCERVLQQEPDNAEALVFRARANIANGQLTKAVEDLTRVIEIQPDDPEAYYQREIAYRRMGETELANDDGQRGRELDALYKSAYAYEPSNFRSIPLAPSPPAAPSISPYEQPLYADEVTYQTDDETSRVLAADTEPEPTKNATLESRVGQDVVLPKAPTVDRTNLIPKLADGSEDGTVDPGDQIEVDAEGNEDMQFPLQPLAEIPNGTEPPNLDSPTVNPPRQLSNSLPVSPEGNLFLPGMTPRGLSTGLPTARTSQGATGTIRQPYGGQIGLSGLPIPTTASTGLPTTGLSTTGLPNTGLPTTGLPTTGLPTSVPLTMGQPVTPLIPRGSQFHANPIFTPGQPAQISNGLPGFAAPNALPNQPASPAVSPSISTALPDPVLQDKLGPGSASPPANPSYRSIRP